MSFRVARFLSIIFLLPSVVFADADNGEFMGYSLGENYPYTGKTQSRTTTSGNLSISPEQPIKPDNINDVTLVVTPESKTIGFINASSIFETELEAREFGKNYVNLLKAKYPEWSFGRESLNSAMKIDEVNFDKPPYNIKMRLSPAMVNRQQKWRLSMTLRWLEGTKQLESWKNMSTSQQSYREDKDRRELLEKSDVRGL
ncbi:MAG: hypothetical protein ACR2QG_03440 [Gammaproteobacteria bacterium]